MELDGQVLLVQPEVYLFKMDPRQQTTGKYLHRASDLDVANPVWSGKLMLIAAGPNCCHAKLENRKGVFGQAVVNEYPSPQMFEPVLDSRRYFTLKIQNITGDFQVVGLGVPTHKESSELSNVLKGYFATSSRSKRLTKEEPSNENAPKKMKIAEVKPEPHVRAVVTAAAKYTATVAPTLAPTKEDEEGQQQKFQQEEADNDNKNGGEEEEGEKTATCVFNTPIKNYKFWNGIKNKFQCHKCPETFDDMRLIKTHWRNTHSFNSPGHCVVCRLPFPSRMEVGQHRRSAHGFQCPECSKEFKKEVGLKDHIKNQHGKKLQFECTHCTASFNIRFQLLQHIENQHEHESGQVILYQCDECHEKFITSKELLGHKLKHEEHIKCDRCGQRFSTKAGIRNHYRESHAGFTQPRS